MANIINVHAQTRFFWVYEMFLVLKKWTNYLISIKLNVNTCISTNVRLAQNAGERDISRSSYQVLLDKKTIKLFLKKNRYM